MRCVILIGNVKAMSLLILATDCAILLFPVSNPLGGHGLVAEEDISRLLLLLYEGAATPARFQVFLNELAQVVNAKGAVVREHTFRVNMTLQLQTRNFSETVGYPAEALSAYNKYFWKKDVYLQRCLERFRSADCGVSQSLISGSELKRTEIYAGYSQPFDIGPMIWVKLAERTGCHASISMVRSNAAPYFDEAELKLLTALTPHLRQALRLSRCEVVPVVRTVFAFFLSGSSCSCF